MTLDLKQRRAVALRLLEQPTIQDLQLWFDHRLMANIKDFLETDPDSHGKLARAQGHIREAMNYRDIEGTLKTEVERIEEVLRQTQKTT